mmetsp:Transcript_21172/g.50215  ORF Transcript_21172/g.50215 Transcript_21172/m.50215 type:complete len:263 (-) Transcript_21172:664-1452(-)
MAVGPNETERLEAGERANETSAESSCTSLPSSDIDTVTLTLADSDSVHRDASVYVLEPPSLAASPSSLVCPLRTATRVVRVRILLLPDARVRVVGARGVSVVSSLRDNWPQTRCNVLTSLGADATVPGILCLYELTLSRCCDPMAVFGAQTRRLREPQRIGFDLEPCAHMDSTRRPSSSSLTTCVWPTDTSPTPPTLRLDAPVVTVRETPSPVDARFVAVEAPVEVCVAVLEACTLRPARERSRTTADSEGRGGMGPRGLPT